MDADHLTGGAVGILLGDHLDETLGLAEDLGATVELERMLADDDVDAGGARLGLAGTRPGDLGMAVDRPRHPVVHHGHRRLSEDLFDHQDRLGVCDVRELRRVDEITHRVDARLAGPAVLVDLGEPAIVDDHARARQAELVGEGATTDRHDHRVDGDRLIVAVVHRRAAGAIGRMAIDHHARLRGDLLLLERTLDDAGQVLVESREDLG